MDHSLPLHVCKNALDDHLVVDVKIAIQQTYRHIQKDKELKLLVVLEMLQTSRKTLLKRLVWRVSVLQSMRIW